MKDINKRLNDMLDAIKAIEAYDVANYEIFQSDDRTQDAIMFNLVILGEAANNIPDDFQKIHPEIPWSSIIGTRNVIVHGYDQVKIQIVWEIMQRNLPELREKIETLI